MKKSRITAALLAFGISASMVFQTPVFATEETAAAATSGITTNSISGWPQGPEITSVSAVVMEDSSDTILYATEAGSGSGGRRRRSQNKELESGILSKLLRHPYCHHFPEPLR